MKWTPKYKQIDEIMRKIGFISATKGWVLPHKKQSSKPIQYHVAPSSQGFDLHADYLVDGKHIIRRLADRDKVFLEILEAVDRGENPTVGWNMKKSYPSLKLKSK